MRKFKTDTLVAYSGLEASKMPRGYPEPALDIDCTATTLAVLEVRVHKQKLAENTKHAH